MTNYIQLHVCTHMYYACCSLLLVTWLILTVTCFSQRLSHTGVNDQSQYNEAANGSLNQYAGEDRS